MCPATISTACADVELEGVTSPVVEISTEKLRKAQEVDPVIGKVREYVRTGKWPPLRGRDRRDGITVLATEKSKLYISENGILYRQTVTRDQLVLPTEFHQLIYKELHEEMGHPVVERPVLLAPHAKRCGPLCNPGVQLFETQAST